MFVLCRKYGINTYFTIMLISNLLKYSVYNSNEVIDNKTLLKIYNRICSTVIIAKNFFQIAFRKSNTLRNKITQMEEKRKEREREWMKQLTK